MSKPASHRRTVQPAAERARCVRAGLRHPDADDESLRRGKEPFWEQASTNPVKFVILLHQTLYDDVTLFQVDERFINPDKLRTRIAEGERRFTARNRHLLVDKRGHLF